MKRNFLIGIITGCLIFSTTCSFAVTAYEALKATFPIFIDGEEWKDGNQAYVINGTTYLPLKSIGGALNVEVKWNEELKRVEIGDCDLSEEELFSENYWYNYYENYYKELFGELYDENIETSENEDVDNNELYQGNDLKNATYVGNKTTKKLHLSICKSAKKLSEDNKVYFSNVSDAKGYTKCKICNP